jgi:CRISPR-associated endonuclease/helicase Cas3
MTAARIRGSYTPMPTGLRLGEKPLAHSAQDGRPTQSYAAHVAGERGVVWRAWRNAERVAGYSPQFGQPLLRSVRLSSEFHDLGKLDPANQRVLEKPNSRESLPVKHWDAGVSGLFHHQPIQDSAAGIAVYAHHKGLPNFAAEQGRADLAFREDEIVSGRTETTCAFNDARLAKFLERHRQATAPHQLPTVPERKKGSHLPPLFHRLALSCLVDADHTDTSHHRTTREASDGLPLRAAERLSALRNYVGRLGKKKSADARTALRQNVFEESLRATTVPSLLFCDSPVGTGKTTAIMAQLLRAAEDKKLRRIFVVLPFTNIITQSSHVYRCALTLRGENAPDVVAEHHHRAEFPEGENDRDSPVRQYATLWHAPIVVVTAVQFFETLASANTAALRKLHQLPGSAIFVDEAHAALPAKLWPQAFRWLKQLTDDWGCHCVLASGSLAEFWKMPEFVEAKGTVAVSPLLPETCRSAATGAELGRVQISSRPGSLSLETLCDVLRSLPGPRLMVVNTVQNAAVIADHLSTTNGRHFVEHISTALAPEDRKITYERICQRLRDKADADWTLVATSCVEAGVDFDFASGLRERASLMSLLQLSGRVNRHGRRSHGAVVDFTLTPHPFFNLHPALEQSGLVLAELFNEGCVTADSCLEALRRELNRTDIRAFLDQLRREENSCSFKTVEQLFTVISSNTFTAVVNLDLIERLKNFEKVSFQELQLGSVQLWLGKEREFQLEEISRLPGLYRWNLGYDSFLGVMKGIIPLLSAKRGLLSAI